MPEFTLPAGTVSGIVSNSWTYAQQTLLAIAPVLNYVVGLLVSAIVTAIVGGFIKRLVFGKDKSQTAISIGGQQSNDWFREERS